MRFYLAPMEGITTYIYRNAFYKHYGFIDTYYTPFVANRKLKSRELADVLPYNNSALPLVPQILTNQADVFLEIANQLNDMGYTEVNLNLGCPSGTVVAKHRGAGFLEDPRELARFLDVIFDKCPIPISIKTRLGIDSLFEWEDLLEMYKHFPIKELIIHARTLIQGYNGTPSFEAFKMAMDILPFPLCYNGDINDITSYKHLLNECPDAQAVMIGRGAIANPELPRLLTEDKNNQINSFDINTFCNFHNELLDGYRDYMSGDQPVLYKMKELWTFWSRNIDIDKKTLKKIRKSQNISVYQSIVDEYIQD
ncbi:MAG: tRNA-dihydrouridine synthase family protein [Lachnospiraceae bacterium]|nr:tRNA-dihydrouridine synthase family protein [Lachnospiraceae bacterium]